MKLIRENMKVREDGKAAELIGYLPDDIFKGEGKGRLRPAVLVIPGGGYAFVSDREKEPVALMFCRAGYMRVYFGLQCGAGCGISAVTV